MERKTAPRVPLSIEVKSNRKGVSAMIRLLLACLLLVLLFGALGWAVSPLFFLLVVVLILVLGWGGFYRRRRQ
jgi:uncharacterized membrane protein